LRHIEENGDSEPWIEGVDFILNVFAGSAPIFTEEEVRVFS